MGTGIVWHNALTKPLLAVAQWYTIARPKAGTKVGLTAQVIRGTVRALFAQQRQTVVQAPAPVPDGVAGRVGGAVAATLEGAEPQ